MSRADRDARILQDATGSKYMACLARVKSLRALAPLPMESSDGRRWARALDSFMDAVDALPDLAEGQVRCVTCLQDLAPVKRCTCC